MQQGRICQGISGKSGHEVPLLINAQPSPVARPGAERIRHPDGVLWWRMRFSIFCGLLLLPLASALPQSAPTGDDYSGMYSFLREGEFVQITIEDRGNVTGFI